MEQLGPSRLYQREEPDPSRWWYVVVVVLGLLMAAAGLYRMHTDYRAATAAHGVRSTVCIGPSAALLSMRTRDPATVYARIPPDRWSKGPLPSIRELPEHMWVLDSAALPASHCAPSIPAH